MFCQGEANNGISLDMPSTSHPNAPIQLVTWIVCCRLEGSLLPRSSTAAEMTKSADSSSTRTGSQKRTWKYLDSDAGLWQRFRELKDRKRQSSQHRKKIGGFCQSGQIALQLLALLTATSLTTFTYVQVAIDDHLQYHVAHCSLELLLLAISMSVVIYSRRAVREVLVSLFIGAIFWDSYLLASNLSGHLDLLCSAKEQRESEQDCYGYFKIHHHLIYMLILGLCFHAVGLLLAGSSMSLLSRAERDHRDAVVMQVTLEERRRHKKKLRSRSSSTKNKSCGQSKSSKRSSSKRDRSRRSSCRKSQSVEPSRSSKKGHRSE